MNNPFDNISGQVVIKGRVYSAKEIVRGLLEQGIAITENAEGLKIGFKHFSPLSSAQLEYGENGFSGCPFIPIMTQITSRLDHLTSRIDSQDLNPTGSSPKQLFTSPPSSLSSPLSSTKSSSSPPFSPFNNSLYQKRDGNEKEKLYNSGSGFLAKKQKCTSCGTILPQNAFFCNKCGAHVRSG